MGEQSVCDLIVSKYDKLTKQTKTVADYVLANRKETQYMSITTLAENCGVADGCAGPWVSPATTTSSWLS